MNKTTSQQFTTLEQASLAAICGRQDGQLEPQDLDGNAWQADWQTAKAFAETRLLPHSNHGTDPAARKRHARALASLADRGLAVVGPGGKSAGLTAEGDRAARVACGLPTIEQALVLLDYIHAAPASARWSDGLLAESYLAGGLPYVPGDIGQPRADPDHCEIFLFHALPLLVAGLLRWRRVARANGQFLFGLTAAGRDMALNRVSKKTARPDRWLRIVKGKLIVAPDGYEAAREAAFVARQTAKPMNPNMVDHLPLVDAPRGLK